VNGVRAAVGFLTPLPVGTTTPDAATLPVLPVVGALLGLLIGAVWWATGEILPPLVAAAVVVAADVALTGALHLDGLADTADGLLSHLEGSQRRLAVMRAPDVGVFGVVAVTAALLLRAAAFASMAPDAALVGALWAASRGAMAAALVTVPYVGGGLGAAFLGAPRGPVLAVSALVPLGLALLADDALAAVVAVVIGLLAAAGTVLLGRRRLGGVTGDVLGAAGIVAETAGLVVATARW
jgi:adenosylcobinamide-GDP ribazoletransferase